MTRTTKNLIRIASILGCLALVGVAVTGSAGPKEDKMKAKWAEDLDRNRENAEKACGAKIPYTFDAASWADVPEDEQGYSMGEYCSSCYIAVESICGDAAYKPYVGKTIKRVDCRYDKDSPKGSKVKIKKDGAIDCAFNLYDSQFQMNAKPILTKEIDRVAQ